MTNQQPEKLTIDNFPTCEDHLKGGGKCTPNCIGCSHPQPQQSQVQEPEYYIMLPDEFKSFQKMVEGFGNWQPIIREMKMRSRPCSPAPEQPIPSSKELILLAEHDWHNREERRNIHPMIPWTHGWITGFLSTRKPNWDKAHDEAIRQSEREKWIKELPALTTLARELARKEEREKVLDELNEWCKPEDNELDRPAKYKGDFVHPSGRLMKKIESLRAGKETE